MRHATGMDVVRAAVGSAELMAAAKVFRLESGKKPRPSEVTTAKVLGVRQLLQATAQAGAGLRRTGVVVDGLHALSMVALAIWGPTRLRRAALVQTVFATGFALAGVAESRRS